jgi:hypothetical protein
VCDCTDLGLTVSKTKRFIPLYSRTSDNEAGDRHQLAKFLVSADALESPDDYVQLAIKQSLGSYFLHHLLQTETLLEDDSHVLALKTDTRDNMVLHLIQERAMLAVNQALNEADINCIWLKSAPLSYTVYAKPHLRVKEEIECFVASDDMSNALRILKLLNYYPSEKSNDSYTHARLPITLQHEQQPQLYLTLHQHMIGYSGRPLISDDRFAAWLEHTISFELQRTSFLTLNPEHHFLYLCAHGFLQDGKSVISLRDILDLHLLITSYDLDWDWIIAEADDLEWTYLLVYVLQLLIDYFDTLIPSEIIATLEKRGRADEFMKRLILSDYSGIQNETISQYLSRLSFREKINTLLQIIFPPKRYIRQRYSIRAKRATAPYYVYRIVVQIVKIPTLLIGWLFSLLKLIRQTRS